MSYYRYFFVVLIILLASCATGSNKGSIGQLKDTKIDLADSKIEGGFEKAMQSYQKFLEQTASHEGRRRQDRRSPCTRTRTALVHNNRRLRSVAHRAQPEFLEPCTFV